MIREKHFLAFLQPLKKTNELPSHNIFFLKCLLFILISFNMTQTTKKTLIRINLETSSNWLVSITSLITITKKARVGKPGNNFERPDGNRIYVNLTLSSTFQFSSLVDFTDGKYHQNQGVVVMSRVCSWRPEFDSDHFQTCSMRICQTKIPWCQRTQRKKLKHLIEILSFAVPPRVIADHRFPSQKVSSNFLKRVYAALLFFNQISYWQFCPHRTLIFQCAG